MTDPADLDPDTDGIAAREQLRRPPVRGWCTDSAPQAEQPAPNVSAWQRLHPPRDLR
jgi:hypothetical protein